MVFGDDDNDGVARRRGCRIIVDQNRRGETRKTKNRSGERRKTKERNILLNGVKK